MNYINIIWSNFAKFKNKSFLFLIMLLINSIFEILSVGAIYQTLVFLSDPINQKNNFIANYVFFKEYYIASILLTLVVIFILKNSLNIFFFNWQQSFLNHFDIYLSNKLFKNYLNKDFQDFSEKNSSYYIRNLTYEISNYKGVLQDLMNLIVEIILLFFILFFLFYINFYITLIISLTFIFFFIIFFFSPINKLIKNWSKKRLFFSNKYTKYLIQGLNSVKEIRIYQSENEASKDHYENKRSVNRLIKKIAVLNVIPKNFFEIIIICMISIYILISVNSERKLIELIPLLGVYLAGAYKILPSIIKVINSINRIKFSSASINHINSELKLANKSKQIYKQKEHELNKFNELVFDNVSFKYKSTNKWIIKKISLKIKRGEFVGIKGESGKGKSTMINLMLGLLNPVKGKILINQNDLSLQKKNWLKILSYVPQNLFIIDDNIFKNIALGKKNAEIDKPKVIRILKQMRIYSNVKLKGINRSLGERGVKFSGGQAQRVVIARALYKDPQIIFFDEPTSELDKDNEKNIFNILSKLKWKKTLIISSHNEKLLKMCDYIIDLDLEKKIKKTSKKIINYA